MLIRSRDALMANETRAKFVWPACAALFRSRCPCDTSARAEQLFLRLQAEHSAFCAEHPLPCVGLLVSSTAVMTDTSSEQEIQHDHGDSSEVHSTASPIAVAVEVEAGDTKLEDILVYGHTFDGIEVHSQSGGDGKPARRRPRGGRRRKKDLA